MRHPVDSYIGWRSPRAILLRRQSRTSITIVTNAKAVGLGLQTTKSKSKRFRAGNAAIQYRSSSSSESSLQHLYGNTATITMKFFATLFLPLLPITAGIQAVVAAEQIVLPNAPMDSNRPLSNARPTLFDLLTIESRTSIFFSYARELQLSRMFVDVDSNLTLLAPTNKAVMALAKKP